MILRSGGRRIRNSRPAWASSSVPVAWPLHLYVGDSACLSQVRGTNRASCPPSLSACWLSDAFSSTLFLHSLACSQKLTRPTDPFACVCATKPMLLLLGQSVSFSVQQSFAFTLRAWFHLIAQASLKLLTLLWWGSRCGAKPGSGPHFQLSL